MVEALARMFAMLKVPVAVMFAALTFPENKPLPCTESACDGDVVPRPRLPAALKMFTKAPDALYISRIFAV